MHTLSISSLRYNFRPLLTWGLSIYAVLSLGSMATMSLGAAFLMAIVLIVYGGPIGLKNRFKIILEQGATPARWVLKSYWNLSLVLLGTCVLSLLAAQLWPVGWSGRFVHIEGLSDLAKAWYFIWPLLLWISLSDLNDREYSIVLNAWFTMAILVSAIGCAQFYTGWPRAQAIPPLPGRYHATLFFGHHLSTASILIFPLFSALALLRKPPTAVRISKAILVCCAILSAAALFLSYSKTLWVALPVGLAVFAMRGLSNRKKLILAVLVVCLAVGATFISAVSQRLHDGMGLTDRLALWKANFEFFKLRPITGVGFRHNLEASVYYQEAILGKGADIFVGHAHNNLVEMLGGVGLLGALSWVAWCGFVFRVFGRALKHSQTELLGWGLFCAWLVFQINGLTQVNFWEGKVMHQMMWALALGMREWKNDA